MLGVGTVKVHFLVRGEPSTLITLKDVLHVPSIPHHLISLGRLTNFTGLAYYGSDNDIEIIDTKLDKTIGVGTKVNHLYEFLIEPLVPLSSFPILPLGPGTTGMSLSVI